MSKYSAEEMLDASLAKGWQITTKGGMFAVIEDDRGWDLITQYFPTRTEAISSAMEAAGVEPKPVETVTMDTLYQTYVNAYRSTNGENVREGRESGIRAVLRAAEGKIVEEKKL